MFWQEERTIKIYLFQIRKKPFKFKHIENFCPTHSIILSLNPFTCEFEGQDQVEPIRTNNVNHMTLQQPIKQGMHASCDSARTTDLEEKVQYNIQLFLLT
jgi:hypothetical protein